jgi:WD40 repeat protein
VTVKWTSDTKDSVSGVAFSRDGRLVAAGHANGEIGIWDAATGAAVRKMSGDGWQPSTTLAFFRDGRLAAGSYQKPGITIWDTRAGSVLRKLKGSSSLLWPPGNVWSIAISPDDAWIAAGSTDRSIRFWNANSDDPIRNVFGHKRDVISVAFSPDGKQFASGGADKIVNIWLGLP